MDKIIRLTEQEAEFMYYQLSGRKQYFEEDMVYWGSKGKTKEVLRCSNAINKLDNLMSKILDADSADSKNVKIGLRNA